MSCQIPDTIADYDNDMPIVVEYGHENGEIEEIVKCRRLEHSGAV